MGPASRDSAAKALLAVLAFQTDFGRQSLLQRATQAHLPAHTTRPLKRPHTCHASTAHACTAAALLPHVTHSLTHGERGRFATHTNVTCTAKCPSILEIDVDTTPRVVAQLPHSHAHAQ